MGQRHQVCHCARSSSSRVTLRLLVEREVIYIHSVTYEYLLYIQACTIILLPLCLWLLFIVCAPPLDSSVPFPISPISYNRALCCQEHTLTLTFSCKELRLKFQNLCSRRHCFIKTGWGWQNFYENTECNRYWLFKASKYNDTLLPLQRFTKCTVQL